MPFQKFNKYQVIKRTDIATYLEPAEQVSLRNLLNVIADGRRSEGKMINYYVVVNEDQPYADLVWQLIELNEIDPDSLKRLLAQIKIDLMTTALFGPRRVE